MKQLPTRIKSKAKFYSRIIRNERLRHDIKAEGMDRMQYNANKG